MSAASTQRSLLLKELTDAGEDGVPVSRMVEIGGMWWRKRVDELRNAGILVGEEHGLCFLVGQHGLGEAA